MAKTVLTPPAEELRKHGYADAEAGEILKWEEGVVVHGELLDRRPGKFGTLLEVREESGDVVTYPAPAILDGKLRRVSVGDRVYIRCLGQKFLDSGHEAWDFEVLYKPATRSGAERG